MLLYDIRNLTPCVARNDDWAFTHVVQMSVYNLRFVLAQTWLVEDIFIEKTAFIQFRITDYLIRVPPIITS